MGQKDSTDGSAFRCWSSRIISYCRNGHTQAWKDLRNRWRWPPIICWSSSLLLSLVLTSIRIFLVDERVDNACQPDGSFSVKPTDFRYWSRSGFFKITLGFGELDFAQVKTIDVVWDIVIGRGGQAILTFISWRIFARYVTTSMEVSPITFETYQTIFLPNGSLLFAIPRTIRDFTTRHGLHSRTAMVFLVFTMALILGFPSLISAMTGYDSNVEPVINTRDNVYVPFEQFGFAMFVIHDGQRVGKGGEYTVSSSYRSSGTYPVLNYKGAWGEDWQNDIDCEKISSRRQDCFNIPNVIDYVNQHGLFGSKMEDSTLFDVKLSPPVLDISALYLPDEVAPGITLPASSRDASKISWHYGNDTYELDEIKQRGSCQAVSDYKWGFSVIQLFFVTILLMVWTIGITIMWLRASYVMEKRGREEIAGEYKAILELSDAIRMRLEGPAEEEGNDTSVLTEACLRRRITKDLRGGSISYATPLLPDPGGRENQTEPGFKSWMKRNKWSIATCFICITVMPLSVFVMFYTFYMVVLFFALPINWLVAVAIGRSRESRIVIFFWSFVALGVVPETVLRCVRLFSSCDGC